MISQDRENVKKTVVRVINMLVLQPKYDIKSLVYLVTCRPRKRPIKRFNEACYTSTNVTRYVLNVISQWLSKLAKVRMNLFLH